jgi:hypothetical protein
MLQISKDSYTTSLLQIALGVVSGLLFIEVWRVSRLLSELSVTINARDGSTFIVSVIN